MQRRVPFLSKETSTEKYVHVYHSTCGFGCRVLGLGFRACVPSGSKCPNTGPYMPATLQISVFSGLKRDYYIRLQGDRTAGCTAGFNEEPNRTDQGTLDDH